jgi:hypothetical protein
MIDVSGLNTCWTITFLNHMVKDPTPTVWVCESRSAHHRATAVLKSMDHIEIVQSGPSHVAKE